MVMYNGNTHTHTHTHIYIMVIYIYIYIFIYMCVCVVTCVYVYMHFVYVFLTRVKQYNIHIFLVSCYHISRSSQCAMTGVPKAVVCAILSVGMLHTKEPLLLFRKE